MYLFGITFALVTLKLSDSKGIKQDPVKHKSYLEKKLREKNFHSTPKENCSSRKSYENTS